MTRSGNTLREGLITGVVGYLSVAAFYALFDVLAARGTLFTLDLLGKAVFRGLRDPAVLLLPMPLDVGAMVAYNCLHLLVALVVGLFVASLVARVDERPTMAFPVATVIIAGYVVTIVVVGILGRSILPLLPWWTIFVSNTLAAAFAGWYLVRAHPGLWARVRAAT